MHVQTVVYNGKKYTVNIKIIAQKFNNNILINLTRCAPPKFKENYNNLRD